MSQLSLSSEARIETESSTQPIPTVAAYLQEHLGQRLTAYISGIKDRKMVGQWAAGKAKPRDLPQFRLRCGYHASRLLVDAFDDDTAKAWFFGTNQRLDDRSPAFVLRHGESPEDLQALVPAVREFVGVAESDQSGLSAAAMAEPDEVLAGA